MEHLYNGTELAKILLFIDSTIEKESFSAKKYSKTIHKEEDNDANDNYYNYIQRIKEDLSDKIKDYNEAFEFTFENEKNKTESYQFTWIEAHILIFFLMYPSKRKSLISKIKNNQEYSFKEIITFYTELNDFLNDYRFKPNGEWYKYEEIIIGQSPTLPKKEEVSFKIKRMQDVTILKHYKKKIRNAAYEAIDDGLEELLPECEISKIPILSKLTLYEYNNEEYDDIIIKDIAKKYYDNDESKEMKHSDSETITLKSDKFIKSGVFEGSNYDFAICALYEFLYGIYDDENNSIYNKIRLLFRHLDSEITPLDIAASKKIEYNSLLNEILEKENTMF